MIAKSAAPFLKSKAFILVIETLILFRIGLAQLALIPYGTGLTNGLLAQLTLIPIRMGLTNGLKV